MKKALVIGGGFAGCAMSHQLELIGGWDTTLIEKEQILYRIPNNKKQIIKTLDKNTIVILLKCNLNWCRVKIDNKITGWIKASK